MAFGTRGQTHRIPQLHTDYFFYLSFVARIQLLKVVEQRHLLLGKIREIDAGCMCLLLGKLPRRTYWSFWFLASKQPLEGNIQKLANANNIFSRRILPSSLPCADDAWVDVQYIGQIRSF